MSSEARPDKRHHRAGARGCRLENPCEEREHQRTAKPFERRREKPYRRHGCPAQPLSRREHGKAAQHISKHRCRNYAPPRATTATPGMIDE